MKLLYLLIFLIAVPVASAASIHGTVYDLYLNKVNNAIVTIDSVPSQKFVLIEGKYLFQVQFGDYEVKVTNIKGDVVLASERIIINSDGDYNLDIILCPDETLSDIDVEDVAVPDNLDDLNGAKEFPNPINKIILIIIIGIALLFARHFYKKYNHKKAKEPVHEKDDLGKVLEAIKNEGGRINQKDLRKNFPLSEAKMSLLIAELESKGKIQKIKRGRGNILVLK